MFTVALRYIHVKQEIDKQIQQFFFSTEKDTGYLHDWLAENGAYPHDGGAESAAYPHEGCVDNIAYKSARQAYLMPCFKLNVMVFICIEYFMQICSYVNVHEFVLDLTFQVECTIIGLDLLFFTLLSHKCIQVYYTRQHLCRWLNIFLVFPFVHLYVSLFVFLSVTFMEFTTKFCVTVSQVVYISATTYQKAFILDHSYPEGLAFTP